jgi:ribosomal protein L37E
MTDTTDPAKTDDVVKLVVASFPHLRCLRCGHDQFYVTDDPSAASMKEVRSLLGMPIASDDPVGAVITLACRRCGHVEQHLTDLLKQANKPVPDANGPPRQG